ncbi:hypothetical protein GALMADRAFT_53435 [Galerina marginata CBS 339.88]|uniref:U3 small nucleolar ribonucleoprotein protein MPP10 n=1 Tax=Galerina marginata (strain CBS 339.88) TaxID=685588 RepID=A0A067TYH1_GALM3|nr:hypothetical protein GALMADRAFT_53435 [Galerina marginata CBS 339.88]
MDHVNKRINAIDGVEDLALPPELHRLSTLLDENPESLAPGNPVIQAAALEATKHIFDLSVQTEVASRPHIHELLTSLAPSHAPQTRSKSRPESEKPASADAQRNLFDFTPLKSLFVDGMDEEQVWAQLDLRTKTICRMLDFVLEGESAAIDDQDGDDDEISEDDDENLRNALKTLEEDEDVDMDEFLARYGLDIGEGSSESEEDYEKSDDSGEISGSGNAFNEGISPLRDPSSDEESEAENSRPTPVNRQSNLFPKKKRKGGHPELDDGFFSLSEFNAETERTESKSSSRGRLAGDDDSEDEDMDVDLFASIDPTEIFDEDDLENDGELFYRDFFENPSSSNVASPSKTKRTGGKSQVHFHDQVRVKKIKATGKNKSLYDDDDEEMDDDNDFFDGRTNGLEFNHADEDEEEELDDFGIGWKSADDPKGESESSSDGSESEPESTATMQRLKHDLFADDDEVQDGKLPPYFFLSSLMIPKDLTTHERRIAALREQITELESENVAPKEWVLMGEAGSRHRPQNSLLEEDLEFDRVMKAVPVTTEEAVKSLEETIKSRILEGRFDNVIRIRPLDDKPFLPSRFLELQDTKSTQSLAQIYENDYIASQTGDTTDDRDGKLQKEHDEITLLWDKICGKLDALCNAHFVPKQPKAMISTITNTPTATLESALPTSKSTSTMLAPEEIFAASASSLRARSELTPVEKRALRTKERKGKKRQRDALEKSVDKFAKSKGIGGIKKQKQAALASIVKHGKGVTVVGKQVIKGSKDKHRK